MSLKCKNETMSTKFGSANYWYWSMIGVTFMASWKDIVSTNGNQLASSLLLGACQT